MLSRLRACLFHLEVSVIVAACTVSWVFLILHPEPLAKAVGVGAVFWTVLAVDVTLGPLLTFAVYKPGKKSLRFDLTVIALLQLSALSYGLWTIASARPVWLVFNADRFDLAQAHELDRRFLAQALPEFRSPPWMGPQWAASRAPEDVAKRNELVFESAAGGPDLPQRVDLFVSIKEEAAAIATKSHVLEELNRYNAPGIVQAELAKWPKADGWLPLMARAVPMVVLVNKAEGTPLAVVDLRPWP